MKITLEQIHADLRDIRYYYSKQELFDSATVRVVQNSILEKVKRYNDAMKDAPIKLYDLYLSLYVRNNTQLALALDWDYSPDYIKQLNRKLCEFLQTKLSD